MYKDFLRLYDQLYAEYGPQNWWPAETPFEVIIGAILVQSTAWTNVEKAIHNLKTADCLTPVRLAQIDGAELEKRIRPSGYYRMKAKKIRALLHHLHDYHDNSLESLFANDLISVREELLSIYGIGPETADSILLYAAGKPIFVVDQYTYRLLTRLGWFNGRYHYGRLQAIFMESLPHDVQLFNEYHALIVRHGVKACRKTPRCEGCLLVKQCPYISTD